MSVGLLIDVGKSLTSLETSIISIDLDVTMDEAHEWTNDVTSYPVEEGSPITDHIRQMPDKVTITGMISDTPLRDDILQNYNAGVDGVNAPVRSQTTFDLLRDLMASKELITLYTRYKIYTSMALQNCSIPRSSGMGLMVQFTLQFINVKIVSTQSVDVPPGISKKLDAKAGGAKGPTALKAQPKKDAGAVQNNDLNKSGAATLSDLAKGAAKNLTETLKGIAK